MIAGTIKRISVSGINHTHSIGLLTSITKNISFLLEIEMCSAF
jgi:hypothetical protein